jgi:hypothetical protein
METHTSVTFQEFALGASAAAKRLTARQQQFAHEYAIGAAVTMREVTFKDFAALAKKRGHTAESLAIRFRGRLKTLLSFLSGS